MSRVVSAHLDLERSSERVRKASEVESELFKNIAGVENLIGELKAGVKRVFPEVFDQACDLTERIRTLSLSILGHPSALQPRTEIDCKLSPSAKSMFAVKDQVERLQWVNEGLRSELGTKLEKHLLDGAPTQKGLLRPSLLHFLHTPFEADAIQLALVGDLLRTLEGEMVALGEKFSAIERLTFSRLTLEEELEDAKDTSSRERSHKAEAHLWVIDCDDRFHSVRRNFHTNLVRAGNHLSEALSEVDAEVHQGRPPKDSALKLTCQTLGRLLLVSASSQSVYGISDLENKIKLLAKTISTLDLEFDLQLAPNMQSGIVALPSRQSPEAQLMPIPANAFDLDGIHLLHERGWRNRESTSTVVIKPHYIPNRISVVQLDQSHVALATELIEQSWLKALTQDDVLRIIQSKDGFGFLALDESGTVLSVGIADIVTNKTFASSPNDLVTTEQRTCRLINLTSKEEYRRLGFGEQVTNAILSEADKRGADQTVCSIEAENLNGLQYLSRKHRFRSLGVLATESGEEYYVLAWKTNQ